MIHQVLTASLAVGVISIAQAETPNIEPGLWEYNTRMTVEADFPFPEQNDTTTECVTAEDIADADTFMGDMDMDECEVTREEVRTDGANYEMTCVQEGMSIDMNMAMTFMGDRSEGLITTHAETPMGPMKSTIEMTGRRIGDCD
ncbi:MAG: DUF3617 domain-containing protein [Wenzhouxiangella sp.]|nr:MAG: DUF3617 domain-containing protein [Wenzhouxiangella sp.]